MKARPPAPECRRWGRSRRRRGRQPPSAGDGADGGEVDEGDEAEVVRDCRLVKDDAVRVKVGEVVDNHVVNEAGRDDDAAEIVRDGSMTVVADRERRRTR